MSLINLRQRLEREGIVVVGIIPTHDSLGRLQQTLFIYLKASNIRFHGDIIEGALSNGRPMVKLLRLCENLGIDPTALRRRLDREGVVTTAMMAVIDSRGILRETTFIDVKDIPFVLATIDTSRCKNREQLVEKIRQDLSALHQTGRISRSRFTGSFLIRVVTAARMVTVDANGELRTIS